jgi:acyl-CoA thioesterase YciA
MKEKTAKETLSITTIIVLPNDTNTQGNLFGGQLLAWMDAAACAYAMQVADTPRIVTLLIEQCVFKKPAKEGQLVKVYGEVVTIGNTSVTLYMEARSHNVYSGIQSTILSTNMKFVRIDENGDAIPISDRVRNKYNKPIK